MVSKHTTTSELTLRKAGWAVRGMTTLGWVMPREYPQSRYVYYD